MAFWKPSITGEATGREPAGWQKFMARVFGTGFGTGYVPVGQGTAGSALFVLLWVLFVPENIWWEVGVIVVAHVLSVITAGWGERMWGEDPGRITIDEFAGQAIALIAVPRAVIPVLLAFVLFRVFDTFKFPFVRKHIETLHGGWGVTLDDTLAGIFARVIMIAALAYLPI